MEKFGEFVKLLEIWSERFTRGIPSKARGRGNSEKDTKKSKNSASRRTGNFSGKKKAKGGAVEKGCKGDMMWLLKWFVRTEDQVSVPGQISRA